MSRYYMLCACRGTCSHHGARPGQAASVLNLNDGSLPRALGICWPHAVCLQRSFTTSDGQHMLPPGGKWNSPIRHLRAVIIVANSVRPRCGRPVPKARFIGQHVLLHRREAGYRTSRPCSSWPPTVTSVVSGLMLLSKPMCMSIGVHSLEGAVAFSTFSAPTRSGSGPRRPLMEGAARPPLSGAAAGAGTPAPALIAAKHGQLRRAARTARTPRPEAQLTAAAVCAGPTGRAERILARARGPACSALLLQRCSHLLGPAREVVRRCYLLAFTLRAAPPRAF